MTNRIINDHGSWLEIDVSTKTHPSAIMKIDKSDWERLLSIAKRCRADKRSNNHATVYVSVDVSAKRKELIHRLIIKTSLSVDHKNGDGLDNRRLNIRECTHSQNHMNRGAQSNNLLGIKGISQRRDTGKYVARLYKEGSYKLRKQFDTLDEAVEERKKAEELYFGEFNYKETK